MPNPKKGESEQEFVSRCISSEESKKTYPDEKQRVAVALSKSKELNRRLCLKGIQKKEGEEYTYTALAATTHPDRVGDILSHEAIDQITQYINTDNTVGGSDGAYRSVSLYHDWIMEGDPTLDEAAFIKSGTARTVELPDGHYGTEVEFTVNQYYKGDMTADEIAFRIDNGGIGGLSIEYDTDDSHCKTVDYNGNEYRFIENLTQFGGVGLARSRMIANPHAVIYKELANKVKENKEEIIMSEQDKLETPEVKEEVLPVKEDVPEPKEEPKVEDTPEESPAEELEAKEAKIEVPKMSVKEVLESEDFKKAVEEIQVKSKIVKTKEENKMDSGIKLHVKEMQEALKANNGKMDVLAFKESARQIYSAKEYDESLKAAFMSYGISLRSTEYPVYTYKEKGNHQCKEIESHKLRLPSMKVKEIQTKDMLDTDSNTTTYTQAPVEFADLYVPGLIDTFNNRTDLFDALRKEAHMMGTPDYGWKIRADQKSSLAVDRDDPTVTKGFAKKVKLQTPIKVYRNGISVTDFTLYHSRGVLGDLFMVEAEIAMKDLRKDINKDLYEEVADGDGDELLGLEAVADSTGNTTLYGLSRSTANRLKADALTDTYVDVSGALTTAAVRNAITKLQDAGAAFGNLMFVTSPYIRDALFELLDGQQQLFTNADFGFSGAIRFDGVPVLVDSDCPSTATERQLYLIDLESDVIVMSKMPQLTGLAKVSAATEAYVEVYLAHVYKNPRRIHMLDNLS